MDLLLKLAWLLFNGFGHLIDYMLPSGLSYVTKYLLEKLRAYVIRELGRKYYRHILHCSAAYIKNCFKFYMIKIFAALFLPFLILFIVIEIYLKYKNAAYKKHAVIKRQGKLNRGCLMLSTRKKECQYVFNQNRFLVEIAVKDQSSSLLSSKSDSICYVGKIPSIDQADFLNGNQIHETKLPITPEVKKTRKTTNYQNKTEFRQLKGQRRNSICAEFVDPNQYNNSIKYYYKSHAKMAILTENITHTFLFALIDEHQLKMIVDTMFERNVTINEVIIKEGEDGDFFYVIESGIFIASAVRGGEEKILKIYQNTGFFGELALLYNNPRVATITAAVNGVLWCLDRLTFRNIVLGTAYQKRRTREIFLMSLPILNRLEPKEILSLSDALIPRSFHDGEMIIRQGSVPDGMYFIRKGNVRVYVADIYGKEEEINVLGQGDYFGERALMKRGPREASVFAKGFVELEFLKLDAFERLLGPCIDILKRNIARQNLKDTCSLTEV